MASYRHHWALGALTLIFLAGASSFAYVRFAGIPPEALGLRGYTGIGVALLIVVGKMLLKGQKNKEFKLHEQGEENCLLAVGAAVPTAVDYMLQHRPDSGEWIAFAGGAILALFFAIYASGSAEEAPKNSKQRALWTVVSIMLGSGSFLIYMFLVVLKTR